MDLIVKLINTCQYVTHLTLVSMSTFYLSKLLLSINEGSYDTILCRSARTSLGHLILLIMHPLISTQKQKNQIRASQRK